MTACDEQAENILKNLEHLQKIHGIETTHQSQALPPQMFFFFISPLEHLYWKNHADIVFFKGLNDQPGRRRRSGKYDERGGQDSGAVRGEEGKRNAGDYGDTGVGWRMA